MSGPLTSRREREEFLLKRQAAETLSEMEKFPQYLNIETSNICNARCIMCGIDFDNRPKVQMDDSLFTKIVQELAPWNHHVRQVNLFFDNEPLLDRNLARKIRILKDAGIRRVHLATNASALTERRGRELLEAGLDELHITIDSLEPKIYEQIRVGLSFDRVFKNSANFIRLRNDLGAKTLIRMQMVLQELNMKEAEAFADTWKPIMRQGDHIVVHRAHNWGGVVDTMAHSDDKHINSYPCGVLWANAMIHADGRVALCSVDTEITSPHTLGDVRFQSIQEIWTGDAIREMRERHLNGDRNDHPLCNGCTTWREMANEIFIEVQ
ncbi:MAG: radical SAM protein [Alphaproteobacteria bacterium]|uniref:radical SAM/SPASM domain-containing protein n=1 Tax=Roseibium sp. TaxID=1936156 RepID=UPI003269BF5C